MYPDNIHLLRGSHECKHLCDHFTFRAECIHKYSKKIYNLAIESFKSLPIAAVVDNKFLCVHGGIGPEIKNLGDIDKINRFREIPYRGSFCDLIWSDPSENYGYDPVSVKFSHNHSRGCSYNYTYNTICNFLFENDLLTIVRSHEVQDQGYKLHKKSQQTGFPSLISVFSAPNYLDVYNNKAAIVKYQKDNVVNIVQFDRTEHPYYLPNFIDAFTWSIPFMCEKINELLLIILEIGTNEIENDESDHSDSCGFMSDRYYSDDSDFSEEHSLSGEDGRLGRSVSKSETKIPLLDKSSSNFLSPAKNKPTAKIMIKINDTETINLRLNNNRRKKLVDVHDHVSDEYLNSVDKVIKISPSSSNCNYINSYKNSEKIAKNDSENSYSSENQKFNLKKSISTLGISEDAIISNSNLNSSSSSSEKNSKIGIHSSANESLTEMINDQLNERIRDLGFVESKANAESDYEPNGDRENNVLKHKQKAKYEQASRQLSGLTKGKIKSSLVKKIIAVGRFAVLFKNMREQAETVSEMKYNINSEYLPKKNLTIGVQSLKNQLRSFEEAKKSDQLNEMIPRCSHSHNRDGCSAASGGNSGSYGLKASYAGLGSYVSRSGCRINNTSSCHNNSSSSSLVSKYGNRVGYNSNLDHSNYRSQHMKKLKMVSKSPELSQSAVSLEEYTNLPNLYLKSDNESSPEAESDD
ncbi:Serine/threonine-protein phosphatase 2B catalytic subunit A1 [Smittium culicis]|uniref:Serine/threonine-protein phosphatase 2B catalytic subunit A1 n=1 Tax=Smittium culicis TaxID=133412 RepID=A0A1R1Y4K9_9FUNG|nr:Serine/threonine-protein phosphatase 2B catalytic subunit A1 [Smittium culicis]